ncbi:MAG: hypothetical protein JSS07_12210 [Proteobacteria bacterium]|nr:hypothetical protein [Pseudomonadota bacterium]
MAHNSRRTTMLRKHSKIKQLNLRLRNF